jgi:hypothetical protein
MFYTEDNERKKRPAKLRSTARPGRKTPQRYDTAIPGDERDLASKDIKSKSWETQPQAHPVDSIPIKSDESYKINVSEEISDDIALKIKKGAGLEELKKNLQEVEDKYFNQKDEPDAEDEESKADEIVDQIEFKNGSNILKIIFKKKHNRMFRIQIFMNETTEIRPVTYTGAMTAKSFWNLLKGSLKKD